MARLQIGSMCQCGQTGAWPACGAADAGGGEEGQAPAAAGQGGAPDTAEVVAAMPLQRPAPVQHCDSQVPSGMISKGARTACMADDTQFALFQHNGAFPPRRGLDLANFRKRSASSLLGDWAGTKSDTTKRKEGNKYECNFEYEVDMV